MEQWITDVMSQYGYFGIFLLIFVEYILHPFPSEIVLTFAGYMTTKTSMSFWVVCLIAVVAATAGSVVLYYIGLLIGEERLYRWIDKYGKYVRIKRKDLDKTSAWFEKYGHWAIMLARLVPILRTLISIPAGLTRMNIFHFMLFTAIGTAVWNIFLITLGMTLGDHIQQIIQYIGIYTKIFIVIIAIALLYLVYRWWRRGKKAKSNE
ncbi:DedA family protein [Staphylococcus chromogenes]|uniref:DedA family protein n=1 Tax=Staphylococcus chromogenes TaxID=46126 RepID=UPI000E69D296|nr:DedA family protein [Staphylococcus chromogenes]RIM15412.1 DedA family protein [Staphylococcus chromogenes]